jgi:lysophospholipase
VIGRRTGAVLCALALALLSACNGQDPRAPFTDSRIPAGLRTRFYPPQGWAWGLVKVGDAPPARYGVSAPPRRPRADIVILAGYAEPAEEWFETASDLNARGYVVWVLEPVGQGGSGRYMLPRDLGYAPGIKPDADAAQALADRFVRRRPLILLSSRTSAPAALRALRTGLSADGVILSAPALESQDGAQDTAALMRRVRLGWLPASRTLGWRRDGPDDKALGLTHDAERGKVRQAWQIANPDLRMGGPSWTWKAMYARAASVAGAASTERITAPVLILEPSRQGDPAAALCKRLRACTLQPFGPAGEALHLEVDEVRKAWLEAVVAFTEADIARFSPPPLGARLAPEG